MDKIKCRGKRALTQVLKNQSGQGVLAIVLILVILGALLIGPLLAFMGTGLKAGQMHESKMQALYAADSGVEDAINWLMRGKPTDGNWDWNWDGSTGTRTIGDEEDKINDNTVDIEVEALLAEPNTYKITSTATGPDGSTRVLSIAKVVAWIKGNLDLRQDETLVGDVYVEGDIILNHVAEITGNVMVDGNVTLNAGALIGGIICVGGDLSLNNAASIKSDVYVMGNVTLSGSSWIEGDVYTVADVTQTGSTEIQGDVWAGGNVAVDKFAKIIGVVHVHSAYNVSGAGYTGEVKYDYHDGWFCPLEFGATEILFWEVS